MIEQKEISDIIFRCALNTEDGAVSPIFCEYRLYRDVYGLGREKAIDIIKEKYGVDEYER